MNAIQHTTQPMIQSTKKSLKIVFQFKKRAQGSPKHTCTLNESNKFYISKTSQNSFSKGEKHKHECNPTYNSTNDPIHTVISQNSLSI